MSPRTRALHHHPRPTPAQRLRSIADFIEAEDLDFDIYGTGAATQRLESVVAERLGHAAGLFFPTGVMAQQAAIRVWCDRAARPEVGLHPTSHLLLHEEEAPERLHGLALRPLGPAAAPMQAADVDGFAGRPGCILTELPAREIGGQMPTWEELGALAEAVRARGCAFHLDGARLWEAAGGYGRSEAEVCAHFDSVYVSFYKGLGGLPGAVLVGPLDFIEEARLWRRRHGGTAHTWGPNVAAALQGLARYGDRFPAWFERAQRVARVLRGLPGVRLLPAEPQVNLFHVFIEGDRERLRAAAESVEEREGLRLLGGLRPADVPGWCRMELYCGAGAMAIEDEELARAFGALLAEARAPASAG